MDYSLHYRTASSSETQEYGKQFAVDWRSHISEKKAPRVMCLFGDLGSGKTTFMQGIASGLGIGSRLLSPTFIIVRTYDIPEGNRKLIHADLYRVQSVEEILGIGLPEMLADESNIICIEWAERMGTYLPEKRVEVRCSLKDEYHLFDIKYYG